MSIEQFVSRDGKRIAIEVINAPARRRKIKTFKVAFVKFPLFWIEALNCTKNVNALRLALALLTERHVRDYCGGEVIISAETVPGMLRMARWRATQKLVELGLIEVDRPTDHSALRVLAFHDRAK